MIDTVIFDFGNVLYNVDHSKTIDGFSAISANNKLIQDYSNNKIIDLSIFIDYETNKISSDVFRILFQKYFKINTDNQTFDKIWNNTLLGLKPEAINTIKVLKKQYKLLLLSNTNDIHYKYFIHECNELFSIFDECFFSFNLGLRKPDKDIYQYVIDKHSLNPAHTLFVDDLPSNIQAAQELGMKTFLFAEKNILSDVLHTVNNI